ncbi:ABC transporter ATP-binding protein [Halorubrum sp. BOL3-1]|uniref:ABC transporter ATP-binding protein n=1 Tax=Halorubrum sp. BOL3-1 TaxID=2497325 RepID=UPI0010052136|nr:ABC transporter ATP-binding protein [Halorubrum sp. BOL3-1]QAU14098.1 ABC transporter ATP-binding protein [Halorubrum sp. BOL3-1]
MTDPAIEMNKLTKQFGDVTAIDGIDLTVERGEIFGFLGPNGAGKSTTINVLLDFVKPTDGTASMLGLNVSNDRKELHRRIGVVPENYGLYDRLSGRRHVKLAIELKDADDDPDELLDRVGLSTDDANRPAGEYSTGMGQRLALAMALVGSPELLILDEPTSGLDPNGARELRELIRDENERGATVFFSSHILEQVEAVSDRVGIMNHGQVVAIDTIDQLRQQLDTGAQVTLDVNSEPDQELDELPNVRDVTVADGVVQGTCLEPAAKLQFIDRVREVTTVTDVQIEESSLEDLFASYTDDETSNGRGKRVAPGGVA